MINRDNPANPNLPGRLTGDGFEAAGEPVFLTFDGERLEALEGETIGAALTSAGVHEFRRTAAGKPRGLYCGMGVCFECVVTVDGQRSQRACMTKVRSGMIVSSQEYLGPPISQAQPPLAKAPGGDIPLRTVEIAIVGAGPAGLAAAVVAAEAGAQVVVLDERPEPGGQYFKQPATSVRPSPGTHLDGQFREGRTLIDKARALGIEMLREATVWHAAWTGAGAELEVLHDGQAMRLAASQLIIATGAYERPYPVPGWTLPGFMATGAAQTLARAYRVAPGSRVVIAGNGPLNLQVAAELVRGGVQVVAVAEAAKPLHARHLGSLMRAATVAPGLMFDGLQYLATLRRAGVPVLWGHALARAEGKKQVERAVLAPIGPDGSPNTDAERVFDADTICVGYGFIPGTEMTRLLGCQHRYDEQLGALVVERGDDGATSRQSIFAVGDCGGLGGARVALAQGELAGRTAAMSLGHRARTPDSHARSQLARHSKFQRALWALYAAPSLGFLPPDGATGVTVCRCEDVSVGDIDRAMASGADEIGTLKRLTRAGMGRCQGRYCGPVLARMCARAVDQSPDPWSFFAPRFPAKPIPAVAIAALKEEWSEQGQGVPPPPNVRQKIDEPLAEAQVVIIGAGILGTCTAYYLARSGVDVLLLEKGEPNSAASGGNAGSLHVQLLAYDFGPGAAANGGLPAQALPLQRESAKMWPLLAAELGADLEIKITGGLMVAEDAARLEHLQHKAALERSFGTPVEVISGTELHALAPAVSERMAGAAWCPEEGKINPMKATPAVLAGALAAGARLIKQVEVLAIAREDNGFVIETSKGRVRAGRVLNAAGGWSSQVARMVGLELPARAYPIQMIVTEPVPPLVDHLLAYADRHLTLKQVENGNLIIGGGWRAELDGETHHPKVSRDSFEGNLWVAQRVVPALEHIHVLRSWAALNMSADGAPILGEAPGVPGFYNATTVNGVTLGPLIGELTAETMRTGQINPSLEKFSVTRFG